MADRIITAEALITAKDATGDVFTKIAGKFQQLGKGAKVSADIEKMVGTLKKAESQLSAIEKVRSTSKGLEAPALAYRKAFAEASKLRAEVKRLYAEVDAAAKAGNKPGAALTKQLAQAEQKLTAAQKATSKMAEAFKKQGAAAREANTTLSEAGIPLGKLASEQVRLKGVIDSTTKAIERQGIAEIRAAENAEKLAAAKAKAAIAAQRLHKKAEAAAERRAHGIAHHGVVNYALGAAAGAVSAHGVMIGVEKTLHAGAEYQHEVVALQNAGRTPAQIAQIQQRSSEVVQRLPTATYIDNMKVIGETTQAFGSVEHAMDHLEFMQKAMSVLKASGGEHIKGSSGDVGRALAKTFEERFTKAEDFEKEANQMIPAMVASGGTFNPEQLYAFAQQAKGSLPNYSMRFLSRIAPSLIGSQGGDRAGTAANAFSSIVMGKVNDKKQAEAWEAMGLLDEKQVIKKAGHAVAWKAGAVKNTELAMSDPLAWAEQVAIPAMQAKGIQVDDRKSLAIQLATMFRNQNGNMFANEIMQADSRARLHKDEALTNQVGSTDDIYHRNLTADPHVGLAAFNASLENLMTTVSGPAMGVISSGLSGIASGIDALANALKDHPILAMTAGATAGAGALAGAGMAANSLMNGFGLGASATALDGSAAALTEAAVMLGAKPGGLPGGPGGLPSGEPAGVKPGEALPKPGILGPGGFKGVVKGLGEGVIGALIYEGGTRAITAGLDALPHPAYPKGYDPQAIRNGGVSGDLQRLFGRAYADTPSDPWLSGQRQAIEHRSEMAAAAFKRDPEAARGAAYARIGEAHPALAGLASGGPVDVTGKVEAEIKGQANVSLTVKVDGPGQVAGQFVSSSGNIKVSTGTSMQGSASLVNQHSPHVH